jgi:hypothetical protein
MTEMRQPGTEYSAATYTPRPEPTGWVGWVLFAGIMLFMVGAFQIIAGLVALFNDKYYLVTSSKLVLQMDYTAWGWAHLILGAVAILAGLGCIAGKTWARVVGIGFAFVSALANIGFLGAYPVWSVIMITVDVLAIYALAVHGREVRYMD